MTILDVRRYVFLATLVLIRPVETHAELIFNLTPAISSGTPGDVIHFSGTLINMGATSAFLNGDSSILLYTQLLVDDLPFFNNAPLFLSPGSSYSGPLFDVDVLSPAVPNTYQGSFTIEGGTDSNAFDILATQNFQVTVVSSAPEPRSFLLVLVTVGIVLLRRRVLQFGRRQDLP